MRDTFRLLRRGLWDVDERVYDARQRAERYRVCTEVDVFFTTINYARYLAFRTELACKLFAIPASEFSFDFYTFHFRVFFFQRRAYTRQTSGR